MKSVLALVGVLVLLPAMVGPLPAVARDFQVPICGGGASAPAAPGNGPIVPQGPCCAKGCESSSTRKRIDRTQ